MNKIFTFFISAIIVASVTKVKAQNCNCWPERDTSFHGVPFSYCTSECGAMVPPYYRNDDAATSTFQIVLPFNFCFWGQTQDTIYINTNGNITFGSNGSQFTSFIPDTFPNPSSIVPPMIAPFWADVDTHGGSGGTDWVDYKITPHYIIIQWDSVGYYDVHTDKLNSFEAILSDGTDPIIPKGNNVEFCYRTMQWTTGDASSGVNGFGGDPAVVGANQGDGSRFIQIGLFASPGSNYYGQFPPGPNYDEVGWLTNKSFFFNLCSGSIAPLISGISPCDTFKVCVGDSLTVPFYFFAPIQGDSVWSNLAPPVAPGVSIISNHPGPTDSLTVQIVGSGANEGYHTINVYGYDNATPEDTTYTSFVVEVDSTPRISLTAFKDTICAGDTSTLTAAGGTAFSWSNGATTSSTKVWPATSTIYTIGVSNNGGCIKDSSILVHVVPQPIPTITAIPDSVCEGDTVLLIASGGAPYTWSNGKTTDSIKVAPSSNTTYTLTASNGICTGSVTQLIKITPRITASISAVNDTVCPHGATTITAIASGGPATYKWSNGATTSSINVNDSVTTIYTVMVYGRCDSLPETKTVTVIPFPKPVISGTLWKCDGAKDTLTVSSSVNPTTYIWSNGATTTSIITGAINGDSTVYVTAENSLGCPVTDTFHIAVREYPTGSVSYPPGCGANTITAKAFGTGPFTYQWNTGGTYDTINVNVLDTTEYTVVISNGCPITKTVKVIPVNPTLNACCNATIVKGGDTDIVASGNSIKYQWIDSNNVVCLNPPLCDSVKVTPGVTTTYTVIGSDAAGCRTEQVITITVEIPCFNFPVPNVFTPGNAGILGLDNKFYIKTENIEGWTEIIYDRWGKEMYNSTNPNEYWDGNTESGGQAPAGVYYYIISGSCQGNTYKKQGFVQLIR